MPTLNERDCLVEVFPDTVWTEYTMVITHLPTGLHVRRKGNAVIMATYWPFRLRLFGELTELVESHMLKEAASTATDFLTLDELKADYEAHSVPKDRHANVT